MHNLISQNQLGSWSMTDINLSTAYDSEVQKIDDYFDCLIECADLPATCKTMCKNVFD